MCNCSSGTCFLGEAVVGVWFLESHYKNIEREVVPKCSLVGHLVLPLIVGHSTLTLLAHIVYYH